MRRKVVWPAGPAIWLNRSVHFGPTAVRPVRPSSPRGPDRMPARACARIADNDLAGQIGAVSQRGNAAPAIARTPRTAWSTRNSSKSRDDDFPQLFTAGASMIGTGERD